MNLLDGETGRVAGEPCEAMKSASCLRAHRLEELPPFFICSWISTSSSSLNDWTQTQMLEIYCNAGEKKTQPEETEAQVPSECNMYICKEKKKKCKLCVFPSRCWSG